MAEELPQLFFESASEFRDWLEVNHKYSKGIWVVYYKKHTHKTCISYFESMDEALCFGWIDSLLKRIDEERYKRKFTPRKAKSVWSENNKKHILRLIREGKMTKAGLDKIDSYRKTGKIAWEETPHSMFSDTEADVLVKRIQGNPKAYEHFEALPASARLQYLGWILSAKKSETRERRLTEALQLLEKGEKLGMK